MIQPEPLSLKQWAANNNVAYKTAWRMYRTDRLPRSLRAVQLPTGTIRLYPATDSHPSEIVCRTFDRVVIYARVHPRQKRSFLDSQVAACKSFCHSKGWVVSDVLREIAPAVGLNRKKLQNLINSPPSRIVVLNRTIISRFDFHVVEAAFRRAGCAVTVIDESDEIDGTGGVLEDLIDAISQTCRRHYGQKRGALLIEALQKLIQEKSL